MDLYYKLRKLGFTDKDFLLVADNDTGEAKIEKWTSVKPRPVQAALDAVDVAAAKQEVIRERSKARLVDNKMLMAVVNTMATRLNVPVGILITEIVDKYVEDNP